MIKLGLDRKIEKYEAEYKYYHEKERPSNLKIIEKIKGKYKDKEVEDLKELKVEYMGIKTNIKKLDGNIMNITTVTLTVLFFLISMYTDFSFSDLSLAEVGLTELQNIMTSMAVLLPLIIIVTLIMFLKNSWKDLKSKNYVNFSLEVLVVLVLISYMMESLPYILITALLIIVMIDIRRTQRYKEFYELLEIVVNDKIGDLELQEKKNSRIKTLYNKGEVKKIDLNMDELADDDELIKADTIFIEDTTEKNFKKIMILFFILTLVNKFTNKKQRSSN